MGQRERKQRDKEIQKEKAVAYLAARDHHAVAEAQMQHGLAVVYERVEHGAAGHVPHAHRAVRRARDDGALVVLQAQHRPRVPLQLLQYNIIKNTIFIIDEMRKFYALGHH